MAPTLFEIARHDADQLGQGALLDPFGVVDQADELAGETPAAAAAVELTIDGDATEFVPVQTRAPLELAPERREQGALFGWARERHVPAHHTRDDALLNVFGQVAGDVVDPLLAQFPEYTSMPADKLRAEYHAATRAGSADYARMAALLDAASLPEVTEETYRALLGRLDRRAAVLARIAAARGITL